MKCSNCGHDNADENVVCGRCGRALPGVEIELYDINASPLLDDDFETELATHRRSAVEAARSYRSGTYAEKRIQEEVEAGLAIRKRRASSRITRPRNLLIIGGSALAAGALVFVAVRLTASRLPKTEYAEAAYVAPANVGLNFAANLEKDRFDPEVWRAQPYALLTVEGDGGSVFVDGYFIGDAPVRGAPIPVGRRHVVVKKGNAITVDQDVDTLSGVSYTLEVGEATVLAGGVDSRTGELLTR